VNLLAIRFGPHADEGCLAAFMDHARHVGNLASDDAAERGTDTAQKSHRLDAVADHDAARIRPLSRMQ